MRTGRFPAWLDLKYQLNKCANTNYDKCKIANRKHAITAQNDTYCEIVRCGLTILIASKARFKVAAGSPATVITKAIENYCVNTAITSFTVSGVKLCFDNVPILTLMPNNLKKKREPFINSNGAQPVALFKEFYKQVSQQNHQPCSTGLSEAT